MGTGAPCVDLAGTGAPSVDLAGTGAPSVDLAGTGASCVDLAGKGASCVDLAGTGASCVDLAGTGALCVDLVGTGASCVNLAGTGALCVDLAGTGAPCVDLAGTGASRVDLAGTGASRVDLAGTGASRVDLAGTGASRVDLAGTGALCVDLAGTGASRVALAGTGALCVDLAGTGMGSETSIIAHHRPAARAVVSSSEYSVDDDCSALSKMVGMVDKLISILSDCEITEKDCAALTSALRSNPSQLRELNLDNRNLRDPGVKLLSVVLEDPDCKLEKLWLRDCGVTDEGFAALTSALRSNPSHLRLLDLSGNKLGDSVPLLSAVLEDPHCKLENLWLSYCGVTDEGFAALTSALRSNPSHLRLLDLTGNKLGDSVPLLSAVLEDPHCKLENLWLRYCGVTDEGFAALTSALRSNPSHLRLLDLSGNKLGDSVPLLSAVLEDPHCKLENLRLRYCGVTDEGFAALTSALRSNPSHLRLLDLTGNKLGDSVPLLSAVLEDPHCKLEKLWLRDCGVTDEDCAALTSALRSNPSQLRELNLDNRNLRDPGVKLLSVVLEDPDCKLEKLWLRYCGVTDEGFAALTSALRSNPSHLRLLDLSVNKLGDSVPLLSAVLEDPHCKLENLGLSYCGVTDEGFAALTSALRSNPSHLRLLDLSVNKLGDSVPLLSAVLEDPHCKLEKLWLRYCGVTDEGFAALTSALRSNPSHLRELDLTGNKLGDSDMKLLSDLKNDPHYKLETLYCKWIIYYRLQNTVICNIFR
ncbi:ribonuclease inhibitor-like [Rhinichthys klamathensis goyatoka]|uniref:ribonuclease inhibitor-like n=1 Tax=Rhinichthys klamathensis goyatoka TaxID=3034132 RepID=UPI0024B57B5E|nr:ribonuclease inhibitor-like [Rhinichthys klamathensis goyatoka]